MSILTDDRAQALQIGAVLLFGLLIILFTFWQAFVVPDQNEEVEFNHNQDLQEQMTEVRSTIVSMPSEDTTRSSTVNLGVQYPSRILFANPGSSNGLLRTNNTINPTTSLSIDNATASDDEQPGTASFWDGSNRTYNTGSFEYSPDYALLQDAPKTVYEHTVLYNVFDRLNNTIAVTDQTLVDGNRLNVITLDGEFEASRAGRVSVDVKPVSTQTRTVSVRSEDANSPITFNLSTRLRDSQWSQLLENEPARVIDNGRNDSVKIELTDTEYRLRMTRVSIGTGATQPDPAYIAGVSGVGVDDDGTIPTDENRTVTVEARDTYNGPVSSIELESETNVSGLEVTPTAAETDTDGRVTFEIDPTDVNPATINGTKPAKVTISAASPEQFAETPGTNLTLNVTLDPTLSEEPTFNVDWDIDAINSTDKFDCDVSSRRCNITSGRTGQMTINITAESNDPAGTVDFAVGNSNAGTFSTFTKEFDGTSTTIDFEAATISPGTNRSTTVTVLGGGDSDEMTLNVSSDLPDDLEHLYDASLDSRSTGPTNLKSTIPDRLGNGDLESGVFKTELRKNAINGKRGYITNAASGPALEYTGNQIPGPWTMVAVVLVNTSGSPSESRPFFDHGGGGVAGGNGGLTFQVGAPPNDEQKFSPNGVKNATTSEKLRGDGEPDVVVVEAKEPPGKSLIQINDKNGTRTTPSVVPFGADTVDFFEDTNGQKFDGKVGQIAIFDSEYDGEIEEYADRLRAKWGI